MCRLFCLTVKVQKIPNGSMFERGFVRCNGCNIFLERESCKVGKLERLFCPCCDLAVRYSPRCKNKMKIRVRN